MTVEFARPQESGDDGGTLTITCDAPKCCDIGTFDGADFHDAMGTAKEAGWKNVPGQNGEDWTNLCPSCGSANVIV